ncbi:pitrilysin family protein [Yeosuana sp. MJ-SS3]|uniref:Pitrilysin family protein n=1 Tax=Gilvirhabdus luticola TaxID=3079858 RepID=A0ABU3U3D7_9FLAO|nr:pitrilysin family protein [Yeosuana sp. MJ-SS3]MDU8884926.1 pitrilysin family protein [Yeosuana sp. MJ-SS3]
MKKRLSSLALLIVIGSVLNAQNVEFEEFDLDNGLHVILHQDNNAPIVTVGFMADVGGKDAGGDNNPERTGFAHFFEHLLASGATKNIEKGQWRKIRASRGGRGNANTSLDRTYYYQTFPSNNLEFALWMDSERLLHPIINQDAVDTQNEVVKEEKRSTYDNRPYGQFLFVTGENLFKVHPYRYKNIGDMDHLDAATLEEFQDYFNKYYVPNNLVLVIAGDIDIPKTKKMVNEYYSAIPKGEKIVRNFPKEEPILETKKVTTRDANIQIPGIIAAYRTPGFTERDAYIFNMVSTYLSDGKSSKLYKKIVDDKKMALQVGAINIDQKDYSIYALYALPSGDVGLNDLLAEIDEEIIKMQNELISEKDYQKLQNKIENQIVSTNSSIENIANALARYYLLYGDVNLINDQINIYQSITREEIQAAVKKYLNPNQRVEIEYLPETK